MTAQSTARPMAARAALVLALAGAAVASSCVSWFFEGMPEVDRSRPVALVETTGGLEHAATTELGILTLGRSASGGPCRVHYFLGPTPIVEDGALEPTGSAFTRARIDLKTQHLRVLDRPPHETDEILAMWTEDGTTTREVTLELAREDGVEGDVVKHPGTELPAGAGVFVRQNDELRFVGLVSAKATLAMGAGRREYFTFAGVDRVRELLAVPQVHPMDYRPRYRPDDISVLEPIR